MQDNISKDDEKGFQESAMRYVGSLQRNYVFKSKENDKHKIHVEVTFKEVRRHDMC